MPLIPRADPRVVSTVRTIVHVPSRWILILGGIFNLHKVYTQPFPLRTTRDAVKQMNLSYSTSMQDCR